MDQDKFEMHLGKYRWPEDRRERWRRFYAVHKTWVELVVLLAGFVAFCAVGGLLLN